MTTWIDEHLAVSPMPGTHELEDLASTFTAVAVLVEDWELEYDPAQLQLLGVKVNHLPIPDFGIPRLAELQGLVAWLLDETGDGNAALVHCVGGIGRSGMVAAAYLVARGVPVEDAIRHVKGLIRGALQLEEQVNMVRQFALR
jgi:protein-tyrosine phosphatase